MRVLSFQGSMAGCGLPKVMIDAAACGVPIIAFDGGGTSELVNGETGWLITDPSEPKKYVEALDQIRQNPTEVARRVSNMSAASGTVTLGTIICIPFRKRRRSSTKFSLASQR